MKNWKEVSYEQEGNTEMDTADTGIDHLCGIYRPRHHELRRGVGKEEGSLELPGLPLNVMFISILKSADNFSIVWFSPCLWWFCLTLGLETLELDLYADTFPY